MSVEAVITVNYEGERYKVEVCYNPSESVVGVKKLIVAKLKSINNDEFVAVKKRYLTLKTRGGAVIEGGEIPGGKRFSADLLMPSVEALFTVDYEGRPYQVEVCYNAGKFVVGVKKLIVAELKHAVAGPRVLSQVDVRVEDLTLKTSDGTVIDGTRMPVGKKFLAHLDEIMVARHSASNHPSNIRFTTLLLAIGLLTASAKILGKRSYKVSNWFPEGFRKKRRVNHGDEMRESVIKRKRKIRFIEMRDFPPMVNEKPEYKRVYERPCYVDLFGELVKLIEEGRFNAMVTGNPGIGKSYFYLYVIFRFIKEPSLLGNWRLVINSGDEFLILIGDTFLAILPDEIRRKEDILRLVDGKTAAGELTGWKGSAVLFASPSNASPENKPSEFMKGYEPHYFFMPVWNDEELKEVNELLDPHLQQSESELMGKVELAGPIPRFVLSKKMTLHKLLKDINHELNTANISKLLQFIPGKSGGDDHYSHHLLKMIPMDFSPTVRSDFCLDFLSREISRLALIEAHEQVVAEFKKFALENNDSDSAKFRGNIYEYLIHRRFKTARLPNSLKGKHLGDKSAFEIPLPKKPKEDIPLPKKPKKTIPLRNKPQKKIPLNEEIKVESAFRKLEDIEIVPGQPLYAFPSSKTQGAYDSFLWNGVDTCSLFQITIAKDHSIVNQPVKSFLDWIERFDIAHLDVNFVLIVPTETMVDQWNQPQKLVKSNKDGYLNEHCMVKINQYIVSLGIVD